MDTASLAAIDTLRCRITRQGRYPHTQSQTGDCRIVRQSCLPQLRQRTQRDRTCPTTHLYRANRSVRVVELFAGRAENFGSWHDLRNQGEWLPFIRFAIKNASGS